ncbi:T6SS immunity protein Tdi1 domain-containing protein [Chryseobacterium zhengzhouense]|uniref:T6SS immunity protein Tdi1 domain-containing protein n=1 Tax=Chryseobacterium zhengzhouense TaxID=1636086 RepID=A0ABW2LV36_9FLAO
MQKGEVFTFASIFVMGETENIEYLNKGNAQVYQDLVFQMMS